MSSAKSARGPITERSGLVLERPRHDTLRLRLSGSWRLGEAPTAGVVEEELGRDSSLRRLIFETAQLGDWDSALLAFLKRVLRRSGEAGVEVDQAGLPEGPRRLLALASATEKQGARSAPPASFFWRLGSGFMELARSFRETLTFLGEVTLSFLRLFSGRGHFRRADLGLVLQATGPQALPIVGLLSFLIGMILAYVGATQLERFGAQIFVADLVGIAMAREMGAVMTAIIMAGRTGAAFAAELGTMQVNEEIDALRTLGFSPMDFLVLPRVLALSLTMPLLYLYSLLLGVVGGAFVALVAMDVSALQYLEQTRAAMALDHGAVGLVKSTIFGIIVALSGCLRGIGCGRSSAAVGLATTSAVVTAIIWIIATDAVLNVLFDILGV